MFPGLRVVKLDGLDAADVVQVPGGLAVARVLLGKGSFENQFVSLQRNKKLKVNCLKEHQFQFSIKIIYNYNGDLNSEHSNYGNIQITNFYWFNIQTTI